MQCRSIKLNWSKRLFLWNGCVHFNLFFNWSFEPAQWNERRRKMLFEWQLLSLRNNWEHTPGSSIKRTAWPAIKLTDSRTSLTQPIMIFAYAWTILAAIVFETNVDWPSLVKSLKFSACATLVTIATSYPETRHLNEAIKSPLDFLSNANIGGKWVTLSASSRADSELTRISCWITHREQTFWGQIDCEI